MVIMDSQTHLDKLLNYQVFGAAVIGFVITTSFVIYARRKHSFWKSRGIPGPEPKFLIGNAFDGFGKPFSEVFYSNFQKYGPIYGFYRGLNPILMCSDPEMIKNICVKDFHMIPQSFSTPYSHPIEQTFLIMLYGSQWKRIRSLISPTFSSGKIKKMFQLIQGCLGDAIRELDEASENSYSLNPKLFWGRYNLDLIARCCFAVNLFTKDDTDPIQQNFVKIFKRNLFKITAIMALPEWLVRFLRLTINPAKNLEFLRDLTLQMIDNRKKAQNESFNDFLQLLLDAEEEINHNNDTHGVQQKTDKPNRLTPEEIVGTSIVFLLAGYETTSTLLTWACYRLAMNPDIQEKLYQEIKIADISDYDKLISLPYLDAVINETLRIDPPILMVQRVTHQEYFLPSHNISLPKFTKIIIPTYTIHHDPQNYSDPEKFDPDRFLPENRESIKPFSFIPFGAGPKICIGMRFALVNAKLSLATIISQFRLIKTHETAEKPKYSAASIILTTNDLIIGIEKRR